MAEQRHPRIAILGTGLIGSSIGMALRAREGRNYQVIGYDRFRDVSKQAQKAGATDIDANTLREAVAGAALVIVAAPPSGAKQLFEEVGPFLDEGAIVTDTCSTKALVMGWAADLLPGHAHFVGGHPMAGSEKSGPGAARPDLFKDATWAVCPSASADEDAVRVILGFIDSVGAIPLYIDPAEHDQYAAAVSHVPLLMSIALFRMVRDSSAWEDMAILSGPAFKDMTRLASGDTTMARDIVATNREAILHWLERFRAELDSVALAVEAGGAPVVELLGSTQLDRDAFLLNPPKRRVPEGTAAPSSRDAMGQLFLGGFYDRLKDATSRVPGLGDDTNLRRKLGAPTDDSPG